MSMVVKNMAGQSNSGSFRPCLQQYLWAFETLNETQLLPLGFRGEGDLREGAKQVLQWLRKQPEDGAPVGEDEEVEVVVGVAAAVAEPVVAEADAYNSEGREETLQRQRRGLGNSNRRTGRVVDHSTSERLATQPRVHSRTATTTLSSSSSATTARAHSGQRRQRRQPPPSSDGGGGGQGQSGTLSLNHSVESNDDDAPGADKEVRLVFVVRTLPPPPPLPPPP